MSSGSGETWHFCEIQYLSPVKYDPMTADLTFIRVTWDPGPNWRARKGENSANYFIRVYTDPGILPVNIRWGHYSLCNSYCPTSAGKTGTIYFIRVYASDPGSLPLTISWGHYCLFKYDCLVLACNEAIFHIRHLKFCLNFVNIQGNSYASL